MSKFLCLKRVNVSLELFFRIWCYLHFLAIRQQSQNDDETKQNRQQMLQRNQVSITELNINFEFQLFEYAINAQAPWDQKTEKYNCRFNEEWATQSGHQIDQNVRHSDNDWLKILIRLQAMTIAKQEDDLWSCKRMTSESTRVSQIIRASSAVHWDWVWIERTETDESVRSIVELRVQRDAVSE